MNLDRVSSFPKAPTETNLQRLLEEPSTVFHFDWREEDIDIIGSCESVLRTGELVGQFDDEKLPLPPIARHSFFEFTWHLHPKAC